MTGQRLIDLRKKQQLYVQRRRIEMLKIIVKLKDIPEGSTVTKITGTVEYTVRKKLNIFSHFSREGLDIFSHFSREKITNSIEYANAKILVGHGRSYVDIYPDDTEVIWIGPQDSIKTYLKEKLNMEEN